MVEANQISLTINKINLAVIIYQKLMNLTNLEREFFGIEFQIKNVKKLLIEHVDKLLWSMHIINSEREYSPCYVLMVFT